MRKRIALIILFLFLVRTAALAQSGVPLTVKEADGNPKQTFPTELIFPNNSLSKNGSRITVTFPAGGGGDVTHTGALTLNQLVVGNGSADTKTFAFGTGNQIFGMNSGATALEWKTLSITNADVNASAAIAYSKLNLTGAIVNNDLAGSIAQSKITNLTSDLAAKAPLASPVFTGQPTIPDFTLSTHTHQNAAGGGTLDAAAIASGAFTLAGARFANNGTTTTILHGNAAGNPTFGQVVNADIANTTIDLTAKVTGVLPTANGGTGSAFFAVSGPASTVKTLTFPNANATIARTDAAQTFTGVQTFSNPLLLPASTEAAPGLALSSSPSTGITFYTSSDMSFVYGGANKYNFNTGQLRIRGDNSIGFTANTDPVFTAPDAVFMRGAPKVIAASDNTQTANTGWFTDAGYKRVSSQFDKTSSTALANITGLSVTVEAGRTYSFEAVLYTTSNSSGGVQAAIAGTATATTITYEGFTVSGGTTTQTRATALGATVGGITAVTAATIRIVGTITVNAGGTLTVQFAQNASNGSASSVLAGSSFIVRDIP